MSFLDCDPADAVRTGLEAAGGKKLEVMSATIGRQLLELELIDEIDLHIAPVLLGDGIRLYGKPEQRADPTPPSRRRPELGSQRTVSTQDECVTARHARKESRC